MVAPTRPDSVRGADDGAAVSQRPGVGDDVAATADAGNGRDAHTLAAADRPIPGQTAPVFRERAPVELRRFLAEQGGIRNDEGHDLIAGRDLQSFVPGKGMLIRNEGFRHQHDPLKVRRVPYEQWRGDIRDGLDIAAMRDPDTGGPITPARLEQLLRGAYESIRSGGLIGEPLDSFLPQPSLASARKAPRTFVFKDGDAWLAYDRKYGSGNVFTSMIHHVHAMAEDIAAMERLGPNPDGTVKYLLDSVDRAEAQSTKKTPGAVIGASGGRHRTEHLWDFVRGKYNAPVLADGWMERTSFYMLRGLGGTRNLLTAALLGSSPLSALSDISNQIMTRKLNGMPQTKVLWSYLKQLNPASDADRKLAIRLGLGMRDASRSLLGISRYIGETHGPGWTSVLADDVLRVSGLNKFTEAGQRAFGLDLLGTMGDHRGKVMDALPAGLRAGMERYGITPGDWEAIRAAEPEIAGGAEYVTARTIADPIARDRLMDMVLGETAAAVVENTPSARAWMLAGTRPGTIPGEFLRNSFQFKGFAVALLMQQAQRIAELGPYRGAAYAAQFFVGATLFGAASIQLREIAKGRDPRPMENTDFWMDAALQGGGAGIFGDLIGAFHSDRIDSVASLALGPMYGLVEDGVKTFKTAKTRTSKTGQVHEGNVGKAVVNLGKRYVPGSNLWYLRAAYEHEIMDRLSEMWDPDYSRSRVEVEQHARDNGQGLWWRPGHEPERAPDMANALTAGPGH